MALTTGTRLGLYEILSVLGAGGMGEVYRAKDTKLGRDVAVKVLPEAFAFDPERVARFKREAQVLASLNHPHIAALYGMEEADGRHFLIMELVEGKTLADRIAQGPIPVVEALPIAKQIAEALEAAHQQGVTHRDLKPANIKIRDDGMVKVLDFGLAKLGGQGETDVATLNTHSPTMSLQATMGGVILGTAAYMSPEQARGKPVDKRTDIWAFGCVLYELLAGRRAFHGETLTDVLAAIMTKEPDWQVLPDGTPSQIRALIERCLRKDASRRLRDIGDAGIEIEDAGREPDAAVAVAASHAPLPRRNYAEWVITLVLLITAVAVAIRSLVGTVPATSPAGSLSSPTSRVRFEVEMPDGADLVWRDGLSLSPDGRSLTFVVKDSDGKQMLWVRQFDSLSVYPLAATEGVRVFFWSADGQSIGFTDTNTLKLKKVAATGGPSQVVCDLPGGPGEISSGTWGAGGVILLAKGGGGLLRVSATDGQLTPVAELPRENRRAPQFLPDGRHYLYLADGPTAVVHVGTLDSTERSSLPGIAPEDVRYSSGYVTYAGSRTVLAARPFDVTRLAFSGEAFQVTDPGFPPLSPSTIFRRALSVSMNGNLAYWFDVPRDSQLAWFDRSGRQLALVGPRDRHDEVTLSPDDKNLAFSKVETQDPLRRTKVWVLDVQRHVASKITSRWASSPVWSQDGRTIAFHSQGRVYQRAFGVVGEDELLLKEEDPSVSDFHLLDVSAWSPDGRYLVYRGYNSTLINRISSVWALPLFGDRTPLRIIENSDQEDPPRISPDGRWIAYVSDRTSPPKISPDGQLILDLESEGGQVYIQSFPRPGINQQVSTMGGRGPRWSRDGKELFYVAGDNTVMSVAIRSSGSSLDLGAPSPLFRGGFADVSADGRFLVQIRKPIPVTVVLNWTAGLKK